MDWRGSEYPHLRIKIDIVPVFPFYDNISIPKLSRQTSEKDSKHNVSIKSEYAKTKFALSLSKWENELINDLPESIRLGYKLAKAMRKTIFVAPIISPNY